MGVCEGPTTSADFLREYDLKLKGADLFTLTRAIKDWIDQEMEDLLSGFWGMDYGDVEFMAPIERHKIVNWTATWEKVQFGYRLDSDPRWLKAYDEKVAAILEELRDDDDVAPM